MARPLRIQYPGAYYHVTCRGNERKKIFYDEKDQKAFLEKLSISLNIYNVSLLAYVCMTNHFHLLLTTPDGNLSEFMRHFNISYTSVFNRRHKRVGHLYQGRYKSFLIDADNYLLEVSRYIHLNPVRIKAFSKMSAKERWNALQKYNAGSLPGYLAAGKRKGREFINYATILDYAGGDNRKGRQSYRGFINKGIVQESENPLTLGKGSGIVGDSGFVQWIKDKYLDKDSSRREQPALKELSKVFEPEELIEQFIQITGERREDICRRGKNSTERAMLMELLYRFCRINQPEIGKLMDGIDYSGVSQSRKRLNVRMEHDPKLKDRFGKIIKKLHHLSSLKI